MNVFGGRYGRADLMARVGRMEQVAGVRLVTLGDGAERGVRVIEFRTGTGFAFEALVDRALDIGRCELGGRPLSWLSGVGFAGPWFAEPEGLGFLRNWGGGLLTTAGLDHALFMAEDTAHQYGYPARETETYGLHGRVSNLPARLAGYGERWEGDECTLWAQGEVLQSAVFGETLLLRRRIEARVGESALKIHDTVENVGHARTPHMFLYHVNAGFPVVDEGSEVMIPAHTVTARGDYPIEGYRTLEAPTPAAVERVFDHDPAAEAGGTVPVGVANRRIGLGLYEVFRRDQLPHGLVWRSMASGNYAVGLEPSTNRSLGRLDARERDELVELEPGESRTYDLELGALEGKDEIDAFAARVDAIQKDERG